MAISMTGCGEGIASEGESTCRVELRVVNNRFFKLALRSRDAFSQLEQRIEGAIRSRVRRGAVQMTLDVSGPVAPAVRRFDRDQLAAYLDDFEDFCATHRIPEPRSIDGILALPGILIETPPSSDSIDKTWPLVARSLDAALDGLERMRRAEGEALARDMRTGCAEIGQSIQQIRQRVPAVLLEHRSRLTERVGKLLEGSGATLSPAEREHVMPYFYARPEAYRIRNVESGDPSLAERNLAVDTVADLARLEVGEIQWTSE